MQLIICGEYEAIKLIQAATNNIAVISIRCPDEPDLQFNNSFIKAIYHIKAYDIDTKEKIYITKNDQLELLPHATLKDFKGFKKFVDSLTNLQIEQLIIHCGAGISRSAGVAAAIDEYLNLGYNIWTKRQYHPNICLYKLACKKLGILKTKKEYEAIFNNREKISNYRMIY